MDSAGDRRFGLVLEGLVKRYRAVEAVRGIDLRVEEGEFLTILGPSGSGKTTVLRLVAGFVEPTSGAIYLSGRNVSHMTPAEREIGMVFQNYALFPHMSAQQNIEYGLKMRRMSRRSRADRAGEIISLVGLTGMESRYPRELSGGQQQRVALARALAFRPSLLLMDEPLGALDRELRVRMAAELRRIHSDLGTTFIYVTHDREEALNLSDRIAIMLEGEIEAIDTPEELYRTPESTFVASFFGGHNVLPAKLLKQRSERHALVDVLGQTLEISSKLPTGYSGGISVALPAQALSTERSGDGLEFEVEVEGSVYMGEVTQVVCHPMPAPECKLKADLPGSVVLSSGVIKFFADVSRMAAVRNTTRPET